jgi:hypothetical protein
MDGHTDDGILRTDRDGSHSPIATSEILGGLNFPGTQLDGIRDTALGVDPNGSFSIFFDSSLALPFPSQTPIDYSQGYSGGDQMPPILRNALGSSVYTRELMSQSNSQVRATSKVQNSWPTSVRQAEEQNMWHEIILKSTVNIFDSSPVSTDVFPISSDNAHSVEESPLTEINLTDAAKERLKTLKQNILICHCSNFFDDNVTCDKGSLCRNTMEVFDQGFYLYTHKYQPAHPMAHLPTFNLEKVSDILLFTMCMIGVSLLKTEEAITFIRMAYPVRMLLFVTLSLYTSALTFPSFLKYVLGEAFTQLISAASRYQKPTEILDTLVLCHHVLFLFLSTGVGGQFLFLILVPSFTALTQVQGTICREKSRAFYIYALSVCHPSCLRDLGLIIF